MKPEGAWLGISLFFLLIWLAGGASGGLRFRWAAALVATDAAWTGLLPPV
jgi:hypothetical protein